MSLQVNMESDTWQYKEWKNSMRKERNDGEKQNNDKQILDC